MFISWTEPGWSHLKFYIKIGHSPYSLKLFYCFLEKIWGHGVIRHSITVFRPSLLIIKVWLNHMSDFTVGPWTSYKLYAMNFDSYSFDLSYSLRFHSHTIIIQTSTLNKSIVILKFVGPVKSHLNNNADHIKVLQSGKFITRFES